MKLIFSKHKIYETMRIRYMDETIFVWLTPKILNLSLEITHFLRGLRNNTY